MILWRYILRAHVGPFLFANATIIFLFLLQFLMKTAGDLVGKGLSVWVIGELIALNLAWMLVLSVPMSVLVATLMAFGTLSSTNEIVIMRASGMSLYRMMAPVLVCAGALTYGLIKFNNNVLPEANIRLRTLTSDILRIKPTLSIRAGIFTTSEELPSYRILVRKTFEENNNLEGVTVYDLSRPDKNVVVTAKQGVVSFTPDYSTLIFDLHDGEIHEMKTSTMLSYRRVDFLRHRVAMSAEGFGFNRSDADKAQRDDRTMSADAMRQLVDSIETVQRSKREAMERRIREQLPDASHTQENRPPASIDRRAVPPATERDAALLALDRSRRIREDAASTLSMIEYDQQQIDKYLVEIYKKYSIPFACLVFVLIGVPLGIMARRGGIGVGAGFSLGFFLLYWACLIGGEKLADRDITSPFIGMWIANIVVGVLGILLTIRSARETLVIDWSNLMRRIPKRWRIATGEAAQNPYES